MDQVNYTPLELIPHSGFVQATIPEQFRSGIIEEIERLKKTKEDPYNSGLVGVIDDEYGMRGLTANEEFVSFLKLLTTAYDTHFKDVSESKGDFDGEIVPRKLFWVNFQKRYEYNPIHTHSGLYSFVIWIKVPYDLQEEKNLFPDNPSPESICSFSFVYNAGNIMTHGIDVDQNYEWEIVLFPSFRHHIVTPFMTTDEPRISIAGNLTNDAAAVRI